MRRPNQMAQELEKVKDKVKVKKPGRGVDVSGAIQAGAVLLGLPPDRSSYLEDHVASGLNPHLPHLTCINCGQKCMRNKSMMIFDPTRALKNLADLHPRLRQALKIIERRRNSGPGEVSDQGIYNGFCASCMRAFGETLPSAFRIHVDNESATHLREMVVEIVRLGLEDEAVFVLREYLNEFRNYSYSAPDSVQTLSQGEGVL